MTEDGESLTVSADGLVDEAEVIGEGGISLAAPGDIEEARRLAQAHAPNAVRALLNVLRMPGRNSGAVVSAAKALLEFAQNAEGAEPATQREVIIVTEESLRAEIDRRKIGPKLK